MKKVEWFKEHKNEFFKDKKMKVPKPKKHKDDFTPERALKLAGGMAVLGVGVHLATEIID